MRTMKGDRASSVPADTGRVPRPKGLRDASEVVAKLGVPSGQPAVRIGEIAMYDRPIEHLAGQLDRADLDLPLAYRAARFGLCLCFALEPIAANALAGELTRVTATEGAKQGLIPLELESNARQPMRNADVDEGSSTKLLPASVGCGIGVAEHPRTGRLRLNRHAPGNPRPQLGDFATVRDTRLCLSRQRIRGFPVRHVETFLDTGNDRVSEPMPTALPLECPQVRHDDQDGEQCAGAVCQRPKPLVPETALRPGSGRL